MATETSQVISTVADVLTFIAPYSGGSVPSSGSTEFNNRLGWIQTKQEEYARRGFWRRLLRRYPLTIAASSDYTYLPTDFNRPNGLYIFLVDDVDWNEDNNEDDISLTVEFDSDLTVEVGGEDITNTNYAKWRVRYSETISAETDATIWYFRNPPKPTATTDKLLLPGDMIAYGVLSEYYRSINADGSQDDARIEAENRMSSYLAQEVIPPKNELLRFATATTKTDFIYKTKQYFATRSDRTRT